VYASSGNEALEGARKHRPSLIFLDVVMPGTSGFSVCRELKKDPTTAGIPVVLVTTKSSDSDRFWGKKQGADDHVAKPFAPTDLVAMIYKHLG
jgi:twitching motility two-component system response regulator PilH